MRQHYPKMTESDVIRLRNVSRFIGSEKLELYCEKTLENSNWHKKRLEGIFLGYCFGIKGSAADKSIVIGNSETFKQGFVVGQRMAKSSGLGTVALAPEFVRYQLGSLGVVQECQ